MLQYCEQKQHFCLGRALKTSSRTLFRSWTLIKLRKLIKRSGWKRRHLSSNMLNPSSVISRATIVVHYKRRLQIFLRQQRHLVNLLRRKRSRLLYTQNQKLRLQNSLGVPLEREVTPRIKRSINARTLILPALRIHKPMSKMNAILWSQL